MEKLIRRRSRVGARESEERAVREVGVSLLLKWKRAPV